MLLANQVHWVKEVLVAAGHLSFQRGQTFWNRNKKAFFYYLRWPSFKTFSGVPYSTIYWNVYSLAWKSDAF